MGRHDLDPRNPKHEVVVGWDLPLRSFFAQVLDTVANEESDAHDVLWIGTRFQEAPQPRHRHRGGRAIRVRAGRPARPVRPRPLGQ